METNVIINGDCKNMLKMYKDNTIDLIYMDPPFFSNQSYEILWGNGFELKAYEDRWKGGIEHYIGWMRPALEQCYRVLKETGSMYLHCDWHANSHLRLLMDMIFNKELRCEVIWNKGFRGTERQKNWQQSHDTLLFYTKTDDYVWNDQYQAYADPTMSRYNKIDKQGKSYALIKRRRTDGAIYYGKTYPKSQGKRINDIVSVPVLAATAKERRGYPTQKPEALLERIISASSIPTDIVLDPMVGGGTTVAVAHRLGRRWIGIDVSPLACKLSQRRMRKLGASPRIIGGPMTIKDVMALEPFEFQKWVCDKFMAKMTGKVGDMGIDGWTMEMIPIQAKQSEGVGRNVIDNFETAIRRKNKKKGIIVAFSFGSGANEEAARAKNQEGLEIELKTVEELL